MKLYLWAKNYSYLKYKSLFSSPLFSSCCLTNKIKAHMYSFLKLKHYKLFTMSFALNYNIEVIIIMWSPNESSL